MRNLTLEPVIGSRIKEDITKIGTFKLKHKVQVNQVQKKGRGLGDFRVKLQYLLKPKTNNIALNVVMEEGINKTLALFQQELEKKSYIL